MHSKPKILQAEFAKVFAGDDKRIEIMLVEVAPEFAALLVFSQAKPAPSKMIDAMIDAITFTVMSLPVMIAVKIDMKFLRTYKLPLKFPSVMFSMRTSGGCASAKATESATCAAEIIW